MLQTNWRCVYLLKSGIVQVITKGLRVQVEEASADTKVGSHGKEAFQLKCPLKRRKSTALKFRLNLPNGTKTECAIIKTIYPKCMEWYSLETIGTLL